MQGALLEISDSLSLDKFGTGSPEGEVLMDSRHRGTLRALGRSTQGPSAAALPVMGTPCVFRKSLGPQAEADGPRAGKCDTGARAGGGPGQCLGCGTL